MTSPQSSIRCLEDCVKSRASHLERLVVQQLPREEIWSALLKVQAIVMGTGICALKIYHLLPRSGQSSHPFHQLRHKRLQVQRRVLELKTTLLLVDPQATRMMEEQQAQTRDSRIICTLRV